VCDDQLHVLASPGLAEEQQTGWPTGLQCFSTPRLQNDLCQVKHKTLLQLTCLNRCGLAVTAFTATQVNVTHKHGFWAKPLKY